MITGIEMPLSNNIFSDSSCVSALLTLFLPNCLLACCPSHLDGPHTVSVIFYPISSHILTQKIRTSKQPKLCLKRSSLNTVLMAICKVHIDNFTASRPNVHRRQKGSSSVLGLWGYNCY